MRPQYWHYWVGLGLSGSAIRLLQRLHLPVSFAWRTFIAAYWILAVQSVLVAALLCLIGMPSKAILTTLGKRYQREPLRIVLVLLYLWALRWTFAWMTAVVITVNSIAILEFRERMHNKLRPAVVALLPPAIYIFAGFILVFAYNDIIASVRFGFAYDSAFNAMDKWILHGWTISDLSHWALRRFPLSFFRFLDFIYFFMFAQIGAAVILVTLGDGRNRGLQLVGTIFLAYYLALGLYYLWPSNGPYSLCRSHFSIFPRVLQAYSTQEGLIAHALMLWNHVPFRRISTDYLISFPCMHIGQPLIVMWFVRRWKRILLVLSVYNSLLIVAILLLEWHYLVDVAGGIFVAALAIAITDSSILGTHPIARERAGGSVPPRGRQHCRL
jgi:hypothetical protein